MGIVSDLARLCRFARGRLAHPAADANPYVNGLHGTLPSGEYPWTTVTAPTAQLALNKIRRSARFHTRKKRDVFYDVAAYLPPHDDADYGAIGIDLLRVELQCSWRDVRPRPLEDFQRQFPQLLADRAKLTELAFEEFRMRCLSGQEVSPSEYEDAYGIDTSGWPRVADSTLKLRRSEGSTFADLAVGAGDSIGGRRPQLVAGDRFLDFELLGEVGRGAFASVFRARQPELAGRTAILKISSAIHGEAQQLARLQHTHIVPVYSTPMRLVLPGRARGTNASVIFAGARPLHPTRADRY